MGFDRNPMRRGSDRLQAVIRVGLLVAFVAGAPPAAFYAGQGAYAAALRAGQAQAACTRVPAAIVAVTPVATRWPGGDPPRVLLSVRWAVPGGSWRTGEIIMAKYAVTGATTVVCIGRDGGLADPPLSRDQVTDRAVFTGVLVVAGLALLMAVVGLVVSFVLDRRRLAGWEADWSATEPRWTRRR